MTDDEIERIRARLGIADALDPREGGRVGRTLLAALDKARAERDRARREAIAACIAAVEERRDTSDGHYAAIGAYGRALAVMRALLARTPDTRT